MNFNQKVANPMLVGVIELFRAENTPEHRAMMEEEILKATYISPVKIDPEPTVSESGGIIVKQGSQLQFPTLTAGSGQKFFMAFTDKMEHEKWSSKGEFHEVALSFGDYMGMLFNKSAPTEIAGFVINPFGGNIVLPKEIVMALYMKNASKK